MEDIVTYFIDNQTEKIDGTLHFIDDQHFEKSHGPIRSIIGAVSVEDIIGLITDKNDPTKINANVFNQNVRTYRKNHRINKAIKESALSNDNYEFFYLNNGITIICESCDYTPHRKSPTVNITNFQIINGGQTSNTIYRAFKEKSEIVRNLEILLRVCIINPDNPIAERISETTNTQIPVGTRDLHANDNIQKVIEAEFISLGYFYERKPGQFYNKPKAKVLNNELLAQIYMAYNLDMPSDNMSFSIFFITFTT